MGCVLYGWSDLRIFFQKFTVPRLASVSKSSPSGRLAFGCGSLAGRGTFQGLKPGFWPGFGLGLDGLGGALGGAVAGSAALGCGCLAGRGTFHGLKSGLGRDGLGGALGGVLVGADSKILASVISDAIFLIMSSFIVLSLSVYLNTTRAE